MDPLQNGELFILKAKSLENMRPSVHTTLNESTRLDENNVDMDQEQVELARTAYEYQGFRF